MRWLIILTLLFTLAGCKTKQAIQQESVNLHTLEAMTWDEEDSFIISPNFICVGTDSGQTIVRRRHISARRKTDKSDTTTTQKAEQTYLNFSSKNRPILQNYDYDFKGLWLVIALILLGIIVFSKRRI